MEKSDKKSQEGEIAITDLFRKIVNIFISFLIHTRNIVYTNILVLILSGFISGGGVFIYYFFTKKLLIEMTVKTHFLVGKYFIEAVRHLNTKINKESLLSSLEKDDIKIKKIEIENFIENSDYMDIKLEEYMSIPKVKKKLFDLKEKNLLENKFFIIRLAVESDEGTLRNTDLNAIQKNIVDMLNNEYVTKLQNLQIDNLKQKKIYLKKKLSYQENLIESIYSSLRENTGSILGRYNDNKLTIDITEGNSVIADILGVYNSYSKSHDELNNIEKDLIILNKPIDIINNLSYSPEKHFINIISSIKSFFIGVFIALAFILVIRLNNFLKKRESIYIKK